MIPLIVANWKMNTNLADASVLATLVRNGLHESEDAEVVICPPTIWLQEIASILEVSSPHILLGAQNCFPEKEGPYTGEVSVYMLKDLCRYVIVGHSERREHFKESNGLISDKAQAALHYGMTPIICIGEKEKTESSLDGVILELRKSIAGIRQEEYSKIVIAYEPIWSISTVTNGEIASGEYANKVCSEIKKWVGGETQVLYGGSVNASNVKEFMTQPNIDGALVGGASLKAAEFIKICQIAGGINRA